MGRSLDLYWLEKIACIKRLQPAANRLSVKEFEALTVSSTVESEFGLLKLLFQQTVSLG